MSALKAYFPLLTLSPNSILAIKTNNIVVNIPKSTSDFQM